MTASPDVLRFYQLQQETLFNQGNTEQWAADQLALLSSESELLAERIEACLGKVEQMRGDIGSDKLPSVDQELRAIWLRRQQLLDVVVATAWSLAAHKGKYGELFAWYERFASYAPQLEAARGFIESKKA